MDFHLDLPLGLHKFVNLGVNEMKRRESLFDRALQIHILNADPSGPKPKEVSVARALMLAFVLIVTSMLLLHLIRGIMQ